MEDDEEETVAGDDDGPRRTFTVCGRFRAPPAKLQEVDAQKRLQEDGSERTVLIAVGRRRICDSHRRAWRNRGGSGGRWRRRRRETRGGLETLGSGAPLATLIKAERLRLTSGSTLPRRRPAVREEEVPPWKDDAPQDAARWGLARKEEAYRFVLGWAGCGEKKLGRGKRNRAQPARGFSLDFI